MRSLFYPLVFVSLAATAQTPPGGTAKRSEAKIAPATVIKEVEPQYSSDARVANFEGTLTVYLEVDTSGKSTNVQVIQGLGLGLDEKAVEAVTQWEFKPAELNGAPLKTAQAVEIRFRLNSDGGWRIRHTAFTVIRDDRNDRILERPTLVHYTRPDSAACTDGGTLVPVTFSVDKKGVPQAIHISPQPDDGIVQAFLNAVRTWRFQPARSQGKPTNATASFTLECGSNSRIEAVPTYRVGDGISAPSVLSRVEPEYSEGARKAKLQGSVTINFRVDTDGFATNLRIDQMLGLGLDAKAMEAVKQWRFKPGLKEGKPVIVEPYIVVNFRLL